MEVYDSIRTRIAAPLLHEDSSEVAQIWRCKFSSLDTDTLRTAFKLPPHGTLQEGVDQHLVDAVKVRRELDLRIGFAFSRAVKHLVWNHLHRSRNEVIEHVLGLCSADDDDHSGDDEEQERQPINPRNQKSWPVFSYGPCQLPTLGFVVKNDVDINDFKPKSWWKVKLRCTAGDQEVDAWSPEFSREGDAIREADKLRTALSQLPRRQWQPRTSGVQQPSAGKLRPKGIERGIMSGFRRPLPLNTPQMLRLASDCLGMPPDYALKVAEELYLANLLTYPRSETTKYSPGCKLLEVVEFLAGRQGVLSADRHAPGRRQHATNCCRMA